MLSARPDLFGDFARAKRYPDVTVRGARITRESKGRMSQNAAGLRRLLDQVFADGVVEPKERDALSAFRVKLPADEVMDVFVKFLSDKWGEAASDGRITSNERALIMRIIEELSIVAKDLPPQARIALGDDL